MPAITRRNGIHVSEEKPPYKPFGRYVCDWKLTEAHLFDTVDQARAFAQQWDRDCNIGWLSPMYKGGRNAAPTLTEATLQIASQLKTVIDHRK